MMYLGDFKAGQTVHFLWPTSAGDGASITRATNGEVRVYKNNGVAQTIVGVTDTEDFDTLVGVHACTIVTSDAFYTTSSNYTVVLAGATIDGKTPVNAVLAHFSIENRSHLLALIDGKSIVETLRLMLSSLVGKVSGAPSSTLVFRDAADTKNRITATVDLDGNRTAVVTDVTP